MVGFLTSLEWFEKREIGPEEFTHIFSEWILSSESHKGGEPFKNEFTLAHLRTVLLEDKRCYSFPEAPGDRKDAAENGEPTPEEGLTERIQEVCRERHLVARLLVTAASFSFLVYHLSRSRRLVILYLFIICLAGRGNLPLSRLTRSAMCSPPTSGRILD